MKNYLFGIALAFASCPVAPQTPLQQSHIEANVPPRQTFDTLLRRDLLAYFKQAEASSTTTVEYELLRKQPTQSGVAYPKYYAWVKVLAGSIVVREGAVRLAAIGQQKFEVTGFISRLQIQERPSDVEAIFPARLVSAITSLARSK
jgi:hypothetical protein